MCPVECRKVGGGGRGGGIGRWFQALTGSLYGGVHEIEWVGHAITILDLSRFKNTFHLVFAVKVVAPTTHAYIHTHTHIHTYLHTHTQSCLTRRFSEAKDNLPMVNGKKNTV